MSDGALLELVSRGKKDAYQIQNPQHTWFGTPYTSRSPSTREIRYLYPENQPRFGKWFDILIPPDGDILTSFDLRITMPTWLPPHIAAINTQTSAYKVEVDSQPYTVQTSQYVPPPPGDLQFPQSFSPTPLQYGWCDGVANYIVQRWALFVDNNMIVKGYGEFNNWYPDMETSHNMAPVIHASTGRLNESRTSSPLQANATLPELVFRVPLPGCQSKSDTGLPLCAFTNQRVYIRVWLLDKEALVQSSPLPSPLPGQPAPDPSSVVGTTTLPMYELCPEPWGGRNIYVNGDLSGTTLPARTMGHPQIYARCSVLNVDNELRRSLQDKSQKFEIRFQHQLRDDWTVDRFVPGVNMRQLIQMNGLFQALFVGFRSVARTQQNRYTDVAPPSGDWLTALSLNVNGLDRILSWEPKKLKTLANNTQLKRDANIALYYLIFGIAPDFEPGGACNLSRCQKALLNLTFQNILNDPITASNVTYGFAFGQAWNILDIENGIAMLRFPN